MAGLTAYTLEVYRTDRRVKGGLRRVETKDFDPVTRDYIDSVVEAHRAQGLTVHVHETYVTRTNLMGGKPFTERYDTPVYCSPSSESYWSM